MEGEQKYWVDGEPYINLPSPDELTGEPQKFWVDGQPFELLVPGGAPPVDTSAMFLMF